MVVFPLKATVGRGFTVTTALPVISPACAVHLLSDKAVTVYVRLLVGDTEITYGLAVMPVKFVGVVPSV